MGQDISELVSECEEAISLLKGKLPGEIDPSLKLLPSQVPFRVICLRDILLHRVVHLSDEALELYKRGADIPSIILVRAAMETSAVLYLLSKKISEALDGADGSALEEFIEKATIGSRNEDTEIESINILTALGHLSKKYEHVRDFYNDMSEFCHPNFAGLLGSYTKLSDDKTKLLLGSELNSPAEFGIFPLNVTILITDAYYDEVRAQEKKLFSLYKCA